MHDDNIQRAVLSPAREDEQIQSAVMGLVIEEYPALFSICELAMAIAEDETDDSVKRAVRELVAIRLLYCEKSRLVIPTRTALRGCAILGSAV